MVAVPTTRHHHGAAWAYLFPPRRAALLRLFRPGVAGAAGALDPRAGPRLAAPAGREPVPQAPSLLPLPLRVRSGPALRGLWHRATGRDRPACLSDAPRRGGGAGRAARHAGSDPAVQTAAVT